MSDEKQIVLQIKSAIGDKPTFVRITDGEMTVDSAIRRAIASLKDKGETLKSNQLKNLYETHQLFLGERRVGKGDVLASLPNETKTVKGQEISLIPLELVASHAGGN